MGLIRWKPVMQHGLGTQTKMGGCESVACVKSTCDTSKMVFVNRLQVSQRVGDPIELEYVESF